MFFETSGPQYQIDILYKWQNIRPFPFGYANVWNFIELFTSNNLIKDRLFCGATCFVLFVIFFSYSFFRNFRDEMGSFVGVIHEIIVIIWICNVLWNYDDCEVLIFFTVVSWEVLLSLSDFGVITEKKQYFFNITKQIHYFPSQQNIPYRHEVLHKPQTKHIRYCQMKGSLHKSPSYSFYANKGNESTLHPIYFVPLTCKCKTEINIYLRYLGR